MLEIRKQQQYQKSFLSSLLLLFFNPFRVFSSYFPISELGSFLSVSFEWHADARYRSHDIRTLMPFLSPLPFFSSFCLSSFLLYYIRIGEITIRVMRFSSEMVSSCTMFRRVSPTEILIWKGQGQSQQNTSSVSLLFEPLRATRNMQVQTSLLGPIKVGKMHEARLIAFIEARLIAFIETSINNPLSDIGIEHWH